MKNNLEADSFIEYTRFVSETNHSIEQEYEISDYTSLRVNSFGKCALDSSVYYANCLFENNDRINDYQKILDKHRLYSPDDIVQQKQDRYDEIKAEVRADIIEKRNPEAYRNTLELWNERSLGLGEQAKLYKRKMDLFNGVFNNWQESPFINQQLGIKESGKDDQIDYIERLLEKDQEGGYIISNEQFRNFLQWHNYEHRKAENEFFRILPKYNKKFIKNIEKGVLKGILPVNMLDNISELSEQSYVIDDGFGCIESNVGGNHQYGDGVDEHKILLSPMEGVKFHYFVHERLHAMGGLYYDNETNRQSNMYNAWVFNNIDFYTADENDNDIDCNFKATRLLLESTCEFLTAKIAKVPEKNLAYKSQRDFIKNLVKLSNGRIDMTEIESMFFENDYNKFDKYMNKIKKSFDSIDDLFLEIGQIKEWKNDVINTEANFESRLRLIFNQEAVNESGYDPKNIKTRFLNNHAYLDYLKEISENQITL